MPLEIERKFLIDFRKIPYDLKPVRNAVSAFQGYLSHDPGYEVRISNRLHLTRKTGLGLTRTEDIEEISQETFDILWPLTKGKRIKKTRYFYDIKGHLGELDIYKDENEGLAVIEVEFKSEEEANAFIPLEWFGEDVTQDLKYKNSQLAR